MHLFCFASRNVENIWRGVRAGRWAVSTVSDAAMKTRTTKARKYFASGCRGVLYSNPTHSFTTPFLAKSRADPDAVVVDIWPEPWVLPFHIQPLGDPSRQLHMDLAWERWPVLRTLRRKYNSISAAMHFTGTMVFQPVDISEDDWDIIVKDLSVSPEQIGSLPPPAL